MKKWSTTFAAIALVGLLTAAEPKSFEKKLSEGQKVQHALSRLTFGARPGDFEAVQKMGLDKWIDAQLHPERIPENPELTQRLAQLTTLNLSAREAADKYQVPLKDLAQALQGDDEAKAKAQAQLKGKQNGPQVPVRELTEAKLYRAIYSEHQLEEQLVDFWFNHFNVSVTKGADRLLTASYERDAIRPNVLGKFRDLLGATAAHPAMLFYLDNWQNSTPDGPGLFAKAKAKQARGINENYARELMELHTLGVDNGYTQDDIIAVARCFTGWTILQPRLGGDFFFNPRMHDQNEKTVLGVKIPANGGLSDGNKVLDILARRPETAHFISLKLAQRFVADEPPSALVDRMAKKFRDTDGDIRAVVQAMIASPEFFSEAALNVKVKSPFEFVVSAVRATGEEPRNIARLNQKLVDLGQPLYRKVEPTGYSTMAADWVNSSGLLARMNFASEFKNKQVGSPEFQRR
ncbi:MAG: DUF1800 domain-containing protein [Bryobacteraceae bacterium]